MTPPAGAELDLVVAKAIGIDVLSPEAAIAAVRSSDRDVYCYGKDPVYGECVIRIRDGYAVGRLPWSPSTNIAHAFEVVERMREIDPNFTRFDPGHLHTRTGKDAALAICLAALQAVEKSL